MEDNKDVDALYEELRNELDKASEEEEPSVASDQEPQAEVPADDEPSDGELSEEEIAKLSPRAQKRIRDLAEKVKDLAEREAAPAPEPSPEPEADPSQPSFKNVQEFLAAVEDEPSRKLLETFYNVVKGEISVTLSPIEQKNNEARFEAEFSKYEAIEGLSDHKADLKKTFMRDPSVPLKSLIGERVTDLQLARIKAPVEKKPSEPKRGTVDTEGKSKEELYDILESLRG